MTIREEKINLFDAPQGYYLAHCITADYSLGTGLAKEIDEIYNMRVKLDCFYDNDFTDKSYVGEALLVDNVYNLVLKKHPNKKAKYKKLRAALENMLDDMESKMVTKLAIPKLGCGHEKLEWYKVKQIIEEVFQDSDIEILVCVPKNNTDTYINATYDNKKEDEWEF